MDEVTEKRIKSIAENSTKTNPALALILYSFLGASLTGTENELAAYVKNFSVSKLKDLRNMEN